MLSLLPLDVGFSVRAAGLTVLLPAAATAIRYRWFRADRVELAPPSKLPGNWFEQGFAFESCPNLD